MKRKELKKLAEEFYKAEKLFNDINSSSADIYKAKEFILKASKELTVEEMMYIDDYVISQMEKEKEKS